MLNNGRASHCLAAGDHVGSLRGAVSEIISLDRDRAGIEACPDTSPANVNDPRDAAYCIYTSGSTGNPNGVLIQHRNVVRLMVNDGAKMTPTDRDVWTMFHSYSFDFSVWEMYGALLYGGKVIVVPDTVRKDPQLFAELIVAEGVTALSQTPSYFYRFMEAILSLRPPKLALKYIIFGAEALRPDALKSFRQAYPEIKLINMYGITETTVHVTYREVSEADMESGGSNIGGPIPTTTTYVLDEGRNPAPIRAPGEIYVGGEGLARGYVGRADLTAERFVPDHISGHHGARLYKTGDLARYNADGSLEYLRRKDHQVKIRGFRIEPGEIEAALLRQESVKAAVVVAREDAPGEKRLVAYVVANGNGEAPVSQLRQRLQETLPAYMAPSEFVLMDALPLTPNGKLDRKALPGISARRNIPDRRYIGPRNNFELRLVHIWEQVLKRSPISVKDDFFTDLGGHSLLAPVLLGRIKEEMGITVPLITLFQSPTIESLAQTLSDQSFNGGWSALVPLQPEGSRRPFFCIHPGPGSVFCYLDLAREVGIDQPFWGIQARGLYGNGDPFNRIEEMAAYYIEELQAIQPEGPYILGGHSFGGFVAYEMSQQLMSKGHSISSLVILDCSAPVMTGAQDAAQALDEIDETKSIFLAIRTVERYMKVDLGLSLHDLMRLDKEGQLNYFLERMRSSNILPPDAGLSHIEGIIRMHKAHTMAHVNYYPSCTRPIHIALIRTEELHPDDYRANYLELFQDPTYGWHAFSDGEVQVSYLKGDHISMLTKPYVDDLALQLRALLDRANDLD
jgi:amino acid adenylation domain-containing protein